MPEGRGETAAVQIPLSEYLANIYQPDCEYIDGELRECNAGEVEHSRRQVLMATYLCNREEQWGVITLLAQRVHVKSMRYRVPDITVILGSLPTTQILQEPPFLCIEILSPGDRVDDMQDKIDDYLAFGVPYVWVVNPRKSRAFEYTADGVREAKDGILRTANPDIVVPILEL
jgi:Uma2 family endonuclease